MGHQRPHDGEDAGSNNGAWEPHKATWFEGKCKNQINILVIQTPSIFESGNSKKYNPPKPGESLTKMFVKQMKSCRSKCNQGKGFWGWHDEKIHDDNYIPKPQDNAYKRENSGNPQLQLDDDMKKALNTLTGGMGDATDEYEPDF